jgi:hypothetical protein
MATESHRRQGKALAIALARVAQQSRRSRPDCGLTREVMRFLEAKFASSGTSGGLAAADGRGAPDFWRDHGRCTGALMRRIARQWGGYPELYYRVGWVHDLDYLRFPHDDPRLGEETDCVHPVPLARAMHDAGVDAVVTLAVLEHAPYLGLSNHPSSRLSATLSAAEDLATLAALSPPSCSLNELSPDARALLAVARVRHRIRRTRRVRVEADPERYINRPLAQVVGGAAFRFEL